MTEPTFLSKADAQTRIQQVTDAMTSAHQCVHRMQDHTHQMTTSSWLGNKSSLFAQKMQQSTEDMRKLVNDLQHYADQGKQAMLTLVNSEHE